MYRIRIQIFSLAWKINSVNLIRLCPLEFIFCELKFSKCEKIARMELLKKMPDYFK